MARRLDVGTALLHLGGVRFPLTGPVRYTMTAAEAVELCRLLAPQTVIPVHYEGWHHFHESRAVMERHIAAAPADLRDRFRLLPAGTGVDITV
ncbi:MBL fold metallo-hydrolase [Streptomyces sp. NPDC060027]|uniref:MBL fold metallo-hydrolase n=1 Tax=Streptomyces sp. NPDC060027 TaxID=3347040 RepID=UPI0036BCEC78